MKDSQAIVTPLGVSDSTIKLDSPEWFNWLAERSSFSYQSAISDYTCNKRSNGKWYASKRKGDRSQGSKTLAQEYLGAGDKVTKSKLEEIARKFALPDRDYWYLKHPKPKTGEPTSSPGAGCTTDKGTTKVETSFQPLNGVTRWNVYERAKGWNSKQKAYAWSQWQWVGSWETEEKADSQIQTRKEHNHRKNSMSDYGVVPMEWEKRLEIILPATQSHSADYATNGEASSQAADEITELKAEIARLTQELKTKVVEPEASPTEKLGLQNKRLIKDLEETSFFGKRWQRRCNDTEKRLEQLTELYTKQVEQIKDYRARLDEVRLAQFLEQNPTIATHLTDPNRYRDGRDLAKFKAWLESRES